MKLYLTGHDYKYAVEQILLTLYPDQRPEYPEGPPQGERMEVSLLKDGEQVTARCALHLAGGSWQGEDSLPLSRLTGPLEEASLCQRLIKNAVYRAALASGLPRPPWGALTGVRPGKLMTPLLSAGLDEAQALSRFTEAYAVTPERARPCLDASRETLDSAVSLRPGDVCLYVGIPFCPTRCAYCSFVSQSVEKSMALVEPFLSALEQEIAATAEQVRRLGLRAVSLYMGGGTPTTLSAGQLDRLCGLLEEAFDLSALREYTVEAGRPDTISVDKLSGLRRHGVDRVSVNPQTMSDTVLAAIGRRHTAADILRALEAVRRVGGFAVNMDLIAGLPADSLEGFASTVEQVLALAPENITVHTLSIKRGSRIALEGALLPDGEEVAAMLALAGARLRPAGYGPYYLYRQKFMSGGFENVGWTKKGYKNLYNICIMEELCSILAMGAGGSTKLIGPAGGKNIRLTAPKYPLEYCGSIQRTCAAKEKIGEFYRQGSREE